MAEKISNLSFVTQDGWEVPQVPVELCWADRLGDWKARWGINRMGYPV